MRLFSKVLFYIHNQVWIVVWLYFLRYFSGIQLQLKYIRDVVDNRILYINSMYQSNDEEHLALVDHTKIASLFGTMEDFDELRNQTEQMESMCADWWFIFLEYFSSPEPKAQVSFSEKKFVRCLSSSLLSLTFHIFIIFSRITGPIWNKLDTKYHWIKRILVYSNEGPILFRGEIVTTGPISTKLGKKHPWVQRIKEDCSNGKVTPFYTRR